MYIYIYKYKKIRARLPKLKRLTSFALKSAAPAPALHIMQVGAETTAIYFTSATLLDPSDQIHCTGTTYRAPGRHYYLPHFSYFAGENT